ncbi:hypothetical protein QJS04_geneDACA002986 [Acorus gramineus]|uniref:Uncharacterized protein n=1 Tax=Acorus gramineus TaxID=55184 RepID=A0AAV9BW45_ACOGR|nr:hypothetical protein QJS04_geneDACA002986 [Acorus gramineus]
MEALSSTPPSFYPLVLPHPPKRSPRPSISCLARRKDASEGYSGGRLVDESMIVLRKRIREMEMIERNYEPPSHWMDWEKRWYATYQSDVCDAVGLLQDLLMEARPGVALGVMVLVLLSVPASMLVVCSRLMEVVLGILVRISS